VAYCQILACASVAQEDYERRNGQHDLYLAALCVPPFVLLVRFISKQTHLRSTCQSHIAQMLNEINEGTNRASCQLSYLTSHGVKLSHSEMINKINYLAGTTLAADAKCAPNTKCANSLMMSRPCVYVTKSLRHLCHSVDNTPHTQPPVPIDFDAPRHWHGSCFRPTPSGVS
jgi:hypothetical protein